MNNNHINGWKNSFLLLVSIGISNIGSWIYLIALNLIILDMTSSPLAVSFLYILKPVATLLTNFWSGSLIDRTNKRNLMIQLDILRAIVIFVLPFISTLWIIYAFVLVINMCSSIFYPTSMVYITKLLPNERRQKFNAMRSLVGSGAFVLGPTIAGVLFMVGTPKLAISINAISLLISGMITVLLPNIENNIEESISKTPITLSVLKKDLKVVLNFSSNNRMIVKIVSLYTFILILTASIDSLEASFSKEVLLLTNSKYGLLVSLAGVGFIAGSLVNSIFLTKIKSKKLIWIGSIFLSLGYIIYAFSNNFFMATIGFFILSFALALSNIGYDTFYQNKVPVKLMGRIGSLYGFVQAIFVILFTIIIGYFAKNFSLQIIVILSSFLMLIVSLILFGFILYSSNSKRLSKTCCVD